MKEDFTRCPSCGLTHPGNQRSCPVTGERLRAGPIGGGEATAIPRLVLTTPEGERSILLQPFNTLGRHPNNSIQLLDKILSKQHCVIELRGGRYVLRDLGSLNGTFVNGERVRCETPLDEGDDIALGATRCRLQLTGDARDDRHDTSADPAAPRLLAHLATDKPLYRPGEALYARAALLDAFTRAPSGTGVGVGFEVRSPRGDVVLTRPGQVVQGVAALSWTIPADLAGGEYKLVATFPAEGFPPAELGFSIRAHRAPRLEAELESGVLLSFYPEGGDLVVGLPGRLYLEARTPRGKPAEVAGRIVDGAGEVLARFRTEHEGRGRVALTPMRSGRAYMAVLDEPSGVSELFPLPEVARDGFTIVSLDDVTGAEEAVRLRIAATSTGKARVALYAREREVAALGLNLAAGEVKEVALTPAAAADAVLRATVYDGAGLPRAERLVFRRPLRSLRVEVEVTPAKAGLRAAASVVVRTTNAAGRPVSATVLLAVVDDAVLEMIERRERAPRLAAQALLGSEVRELADAHVYLEQDESAARKLDLLLGSQGWRRFAFHDATKFLAEHGDRAERALARRRPAAPTEWQTAVAFAPAMAPALRAALHAPAAGSAVPLLEAGTALGAHDERSGAKAHPPIMAAQPPAPRVQVAPPSSSIPAAAVPRHGEMIFGPPLMPAQTPARKPITAGGRIRPAAPPMPQPILAVREYAHRASALFDGSRTDFAETLYWNAGITTPRTGEAKVTFDLCDSVTTFRVRADAVSADGALGLGDAVLEACRPFYIEPKLPQQVSAGDVIEATVTVVNGTQDRIDAEVSLAVTGALIASPNATSIGVGAESRERILVPIAVGPGRGVASVAVRAHAGAHADQVTRALEVASAGFPITIAAAGRIEAGGAATHVMALPDAVEPGSITTEVIFYPSPLASLTQALEALLREPCGGFEQASSTSYPNVLGLHFLASHLGADPRLLRRAAELIERGSPQVMELADMATVSTVSGEMLSRTVAWLSSRRDGRGGFTRDPRAVDSFGAAPDDVTDAYITWSLGQAGVSGLEAEVARVRANALESDDAYGLALAANVILDAGDTAGAPVLARLAAKQDADGAVRGAATSITGSGGADLVVETTSLAILAWLKASARDEAGAGGSLPADRADRAMEWLLARCMGGRFGATQATILALKAIVAHDAARRRLKQAGSVVVSVNGEPCVEASFTADHECTITLPSFAGALSPGERRVELRMKEGAPMPYSLRISYATALPPSAPACKVGLTTALARAEITEGEPVDLRVEVVNLTEEGLPRVVAIVGLPGGLEARVDWLKRLVSDGSVDCWETRGREVVLYWRSIAPRARRALTLSLIGEVPGTYSAPLSRAYLYYNDEDRSWAPPLRARVISGR
jgi:hypothetical protein